MGRLRAAHQNPDSRFQVRNGAGETPLMLVCRKGHAQAGEWEGGRISKKLPVQPAFCCHVTCRLSRRPSSCWRCVLTRRPTAKRRCRMFCAGCGGRDEARGHAAADCAAPRLPGAHQKGPGPKRDERDEREGTGTRTTASALPASPCTGDGARALLRGGPAAAGDPQPRSAEE